MIKRWLMFISFILLSLPGLFSAATPLTIHKITQLDSLQKLEHRKVVMFLYTDWCRYCRAMEQTTLRDKNVIRQLNEQFYFIALNAEEKTDILFQGQKFRYKPTGAGEGIHQLALKLAGNGSEVAFPLICILNPQHDVIFQHSGFLRLQELIKILRSCLVDAL